MRVADILALAETLQRDAEHDSVGRDAARTAASALKVRLLPGPPVLYEQPRANVCPLTNQLALQSTSATILDLSHQLFGIRERQPLLLEALSASARQLRVAAENGAQS